MSNLKTPLNPADLAKTWPTVEADLDRLERPPEPTPEPPKAVAQPGWTDERLATLERMYRDGKTFEQMGRKLHLSKVAVFNKIKRLGWEGRRAAS